ncbi:malonate--CoA ligase ACSF3, mitochondrial [Nilaparvata lugens]|uniref:malonate--CoA ligase ACSF3, mitochondrial n=1 Tax=Nilaparvata lugens TaxID=108931 RepID=UPI00193CBDA1|nr:malonate--CoA ligase ACSF3, mitochondrial [Nilaparvata lugens]
MLSRLTSFRKNTSIMFINKQIALIGWNQSAKISKCPLITLNAARFISCRPFIYGQNFHSQNCNHKKEENNTNEVALSIFNRALHFEDKIALKDQFGLYTYSSLLQASIKLSKEYGENLQGKFGERVAFLCPNDSSYIFALWASWINGQIAVPLSPLHPESMLEYYVEDCSAQLLVTTSEYAPLLEPISSKEGIKLIVLDKSLRDDAVATEINNGSEVKMETCEPIISHQSFQLPNRFYDENDALIIYTSGSTGMPKGVVVSHRSLQTQIENMLTAWSWRASDCILHTLPLHHTHGIINALLCPLAAGAKSIHKQSVAVDLKFFFRLFMCGSAPLPVQIFDRWKTITGHAILERYGMTETGMTLTNPLQGERLSGRVGTPFPSVRVRLVNSNDGSTLSIGTSKSTKLLQKTKEDVVAGELQVQGENLFKQYFNKPDKTAEEFTSDGWFKTGDYAEYNTKSDSYAILGRTSVDIIKTGGYKVSAIHVETALRDHPDIDDLAIIGIPDFTWGQKVAAVIVPKQGIELDLIKLKEWTKAKLPPYEIPSVYKLVSKIPRNAMGKVNKRDLTKQLFPEGRMKGLQSQ